MIAPQSKAIVKPVRRSRGKSLFVLLWVVVPLCIVGVGMFFLNKSEEAVSPKNKGKDLQIQEVQPSAGMPKQDVVQEEEQKDDGKRRTAKGTVIPEKVQPDERGVLRYPNGQRWVDPNDLHLVKYPQKRKLFKRNCDNQIANILVMDPSKMAPHLVGRRFPYGEAFVKDFCESLHDTYEADPEDTAEEAELRRLVVETRKDLQTAMEAGEDIAKMMNRAQDELDRLCQYHDTLKTEIRKIDYDENVSDDEFRQFVETANGLLQKQGLKGLTMPNIAMRQARLKKMKEHNSSMEKDSNK